MALLFIDVINDLEFPDNRVLVMRDSGLAAHIAALKARARAARAPVIYVNDSFGKRRSACKKQVNHCLHDRVLGQVLAERLPPQPEDYFVLKPKHSGFFSTNLETILKYLGVHTLILAGIAGDRCILFTATTPSCGTSAYLYPRIALSSTTRD